MACSGRVLTASFGLWEQMFHQIRIRVVTEKLQGFEMKIRQI